MCTTNIPTDWVMRHIFSMCLLSIFSILSGQWPGGGASKFLTLRASPPARRGQPLWKMNMVGLCVCMGWVSLAPKSWNLSLENTRKSRPKARKWGQIIVQSRLGRLQNLAKKQTRNRKEARVSQPPLLGYYFDPLFGTRDFSFGGTQLFEGSSFGFRFGVRFVTHFVTENSSKRRPKRQEKE